MMDATTYLNQVRLELCLRVAVEFDLAKPYLHFGRVRVHARDDGPKHLSECEGPVPRLPKQIHVDVSEHTLQCFTLGLGEEAAATQRTR